MRLISLLAASAAIVTGTLALAQDGESPEHLAVEMRHGHMLQFAANIGVLGGMAQGNTPYDAAAAQTAADNLVHLASVQWGYMWPEGTAQGETEEESAALPAVWENPDDFEAKHGALLEAATAMQAAAGGGLEGLQGAMPALGGACGGCHESYRAKEG